MPTVLVVDDTASIRFLIRTNLELAGFEVTEAVDGVDGLEQLRAAAQAGTLPDAVTIDVMMPRQGGVATVAAIRSDPLLRDLALVMLTTQNHPADVQRGLQAGVDAYVTKPFDPDELVQTVRTAIESRAD
ncbi:response regulator transcription factor [Aeromicrobium sp. CF4.19]|uniref:response regulator transcription factor n=1 Tax=Aeromicrobium sp. CF4.19 TaxID=3373082 RepID=UPI003EE579E5